MSPRSAAFLPPPPRAGGALPARPAATAPRPPGGRRLGPLAATALSLLLGASPAGAYRASGSAPAPPAAPAAPTLCPAEGKGGAAAAPPGVAPPAAPSRATSPAPVAGAPGVPSMGILDMGKVVAVALSNHPLVGQADADSAAAAARLGQARSARLPRVAATGSWARLRATTDTESRDAWHAGGAVAQLLADFGRTRGSVDRGASLLAAAKDSAEAVRLQVAFDARMAYLEALRAERILDVRRRADHQRVALLSQARSYYDAGLRARIDVARAEANLYQARADVNAAANDVALSRAALLERMGVDGPADFALAPSPPVAVYPGTRDDWRAASSSRPELAAARQRVAAGEAALLQARAEHAPRLDGAGWYGYGGEDAPLRQDWSVGVLLTVPVFNGYQTTEQVREAEASLLSSRRALDALSRQVRLQVEQASLALHEAWDRIEVRKKQAEAARENLTLATGRYEAGAGDIIEMTDAQFQSDQAETALVESQFDYNAAVAALERAIGR